MAKIIKPPYFESVVNAGEKRLLDFLEVNLPDNYYLVPNVEIASTNPRNNRTQYWEYDLIVVAPHAIYNIENKDWKGRIEGDDNYWHLNDRQKPNPLKTGRQKTAILASKLKENESSWSKAWVQNMVTLSFPNTFTPLLWKGAAKLTFGLNEHLLKYISESDQVDKNENEISDIQKEIVEFLIGKQSIKSPDNKSEVVGYEIIEILQQEPNLTEYLAKPKGVSSAIRKKVKEYVLQVAGLSPSELRKREETIKNQYKALNKIKANPFILNVEFIVDEENHLFYEISDYLDESSLRAVAHSKTFTFQEKINIIRNLMSALKEAHEENIFHRDINPENIFLNQGYAFLGNFGKSYFIDHNEEGYTVLATINEENASAYHPLELTTGDASRASDIYSLGVLIYWLFTGQEPFSSPFVLDRMGGKLPPEKFPTSINASLPSWLDDICNHTILTIESNRLDNVNEVESLINEALEKNLPESKAKEERIVKQLSSTHELGEGDRIDDYTIYKLLGKGGYSLVYRVKHRMQGKEYALKLFHESVNISSVLDEYSTLKELNHSNIVKFIWNGTTSNGQFYTITEFLDGENLDMYVQSDARLPISTVYKVAYDILSALIVMQKQEKPIFHRDIKPQNIIWKNHEHFVLIDFNVASFANTNKDFVGTNPYLAPDLITENNKVDWDKSADTFALGITLYQLISHHYPWSHAKRPLMSELPKPLTDLVPNISDSFSAFIHKAIITDKNKRFTSAQEMFEQLQSIGEDNVLKEKTSIYGEVSVPDHLYRTSIMIYQEGTQIKLYDKSEPFFNLITTIDHVLRKFRDDLSKYKSSLSLQKSITLQLKVDSDIIISEAFWHGGAKSYTENSIDKVYQSLKETFNNHKDKIKSFKVDIEGLNIVEYINSLYSQSRRGNFGTRASYSISEYDRLTYSPSKLDCKLIPDIIDGKYRLVIITGNAGDGKTAFIRKIEEDKGISELKRFEHKNGAAFYLNGIAFESNYDGSQDEEGKVNNTVLEQFFQPFENINNKYMDATEGRIIAINEGRLVEFLNTSVKHRNLADTIEEYFYKEGRYTLPSGLMIINLNLRSVTARDDKEPSLFRQQMKVLTRKELWAKCDACPLVKQCFIKYNVDTFNDSAAGNEVITRMEWLLRTVSLKRELHITMRDLRSFIAFTLTHDFDCEDVKELITNINHPEDYWQYYYFNLTNPNSSDSGNQDRLIKLMRETDIGEVALPSVDRDLFFEKHQNKNYLEFSERQISLCDVFNQNKLLLPVYEQESDVTEKIKTVQKIFIRHQYFEGKAGLIDFDDNLNKLSDDNKSLKMQSFLLRLPYHSVFKFVNILKRKKVDADTLQSVSRAISLNEGNDNEAISKDYLVLGSTEVNDPYSSSYRLFKLTDFELLISSTDYLVKYLEYEPDSLIFRHRNEKHIKLTISLDLYEILFFIQQGFSPSLNDLRGKFIELIIFKNLIKNLNYKEVVVTKDNLNYFRISKDSNNHIFVNTINF